MATQRTIPLWILIVTGIFALMEIGVSISIFMSPEAVLNEKVDLSAKGVHYLANMWAVRQLALGVIFAYAALKRSLPMLTLSYIFFLVMFIGDLVIGVLEKENTMVITTAVMCLIAFAMLYVISKRKESQNG